LALTGGTSLTILLEDGRLVNAKVSRREKWNTFALRFPDGEGWICTTPVVLSPKLSKTA